MIRNNPYRHYPPPGWNEMRSAPRDGTIVELANNYGVAPTYSLCKWGADGFGEQWINIDAKNGGHPTDGDHLSWRPYSGDPANYTDPTFGAQWTRNYWLMACGMPPAADGDEDMRERSKSPPPKINQAEPPQSTVIAPANHRGSGFQPLLALLAITLAILGAVFIIIP